MASGGGTSRPHNASQEQVLHQLTPAMHSIVYQQLNKGLSASCMCSPAMWQGRRQRSFMS
jgi:hypothetical protein